MMIYDGSGSAYSMLQYRIYSRIYSTIYCTVGSTLGKVSVCRKANTSTIEKYMITTMMENGLKKRIWFWPLTWHKSSPIVKINYKNIFCRRLSEISPIHHYNSHPCICLYDFYKLLLKQPFNQKCSLPSTAYSKMHELLWRCTDQRDRNGINSLKNSMNTFFSIILHSQYR